MDSATAYRFGPFELRPAEHILTRDGRRVLLSPKAFDLLRLLIERHGAVVEKRELLQTLWPNTFVEEANLSVHIAAVRKAVAAYGAHPVIETVPKRGYRFVAPVQQVIAQMTAATPPVAVRLLILPLRLLSRNPETQFLSLSLPDAIAASLAEIPGLSVRAPLDFRSSAVADLPAIMASGTADVVLDGALAELAGETCLRLSLLRVPSGIVLHAEQTVIKLSKLFALQSRVSRQIAQAVAAHLGRAEALDTRTRVPTTPGAYVLYLRANQLAYETSQWASARDLYEAALREDPNYAPAWARLARCHRVIGKFLAPPIDTPGLFARAEDAFQRALSLDPDLSLAHSLYAQLEVDTGRSEQAMLRLIARARRHPHAPDLFSGLVHALRFCGLLDLSIAAHRRARTLDPTVPTSIHHTWWMKGEYEKALSETFGDSRVHARAGARIAWAEPRGNRCVEVA
jgi:DNA-binding winged helix-turn-helix (wHTH) protein/tetratricopeptide (TPR) repeat protein